jgi:hypothetical protein
MMLYIFARKERLDILGKLPIRGFVVKLGGHWHLLDFYDSKSRQVTASNAKRVGYGGPTQPDIFNCEKLRNVEAKSKWNEN